MPSDEIVDVSGRRLKRRRQWVLRVGVPLLGVALVILSILGVSLYSYQQNRNAALTLSRSTLAGLQSRIGSEVNFYLAPATQATLIARDMVARGAISDGRSAIEGYAASMLGQVPHLQGFYAANGEGDFIMVQRDPTGGTRTKIILNPPGKRQVSSVHLDANGQFVDANLAPGDDFDPRTRSWYQGAMKTNGVFWSQPYIFYTTKAPGITAAIRLIQQGSPDRVFGVDITLEALSNFLASLHIGITGRAAIVDRDGNLIAAPSMISKVGIPQAGGKAEQAVHATMLTLGDAALTGAFDRFRVEGYGNRTVMIGTQRYVTIASRLPAAGQDWVLLIVAPESDFTALAQSNGRQSLLLSLITILLAALLGGLLIHQNRRTDRLRRLLAQEKESGLREAQLLSNLASQPGLFDSERPAPGLTESLAEIGAARRSSIWRLAGEGRILHCQDQFDIEQNFHSDGVELSRSELPRFFAALDSGETIAVADAARDQRTAELHRLLMRPFGSQRLSVLPVRGPTGIIGAMLIEDARQPDRAANLAKAVAGIVAMRLAGTADLIPPAETDEATIGDGAAPLMAAAEGTQPFSSELVTPSSPASSTPDGDGLAPKRAASHFSAVTAMIIRFDDAVSLARPDQTGVTALADDIARAMQEIASRFALPYMKITGHHLVAATGCTAQPDPGSSARLADAALAARDACMSLLAKAGLDPVFHIGIDFDTALGGVLGEAPRVFNLWGNAIRTAEQMAHSAPEPGTIQVSEAAHTRLRREFLFRARGVFFIPRTGATRTYVMAGRR